MTAISPTPEDQVLFLRNIQRLLFEGQFTASYKFALLHAIADLCILKGDDSGGAMVLDVKDIAEKFIELYWQQCRPFQLGSQETGIVLQQNTGRQAVVISTVVKAQDDFGGSLFKLKQVAPDLWRSLKGSVKRVVNEMPLWKLQTVGNERLDFLYENLDTTTKTITLKKGIAFCFRAFYGLMRDLIQGAWIRFVQKLNANDLGNLTDLGTFMFDQERSSLDAYKNILLDVQERQCFYCHKDMQRSVDVDHFIPWSRYPTDLGHNFVLAHPRCNNAKSDYLAAEQHLKSWAERNRDRSQGLADRLSDAGLPSDSSASLRITEWSYAQVENAKGQVWLKDSAFFHLGPNWRGLLVSWGRKGVRDRFYWATKF